MQRLPSIVLLVLVGVLPFGGADSKAQENKKSLNLSHCVVSLLAEAHVPARKPGVILSYTVAEGTTVKAGAQLAQIDDAEVRVHLTVAQQQAEAARRQAENDIDVQYANAAAKVAEAEVDSAEKANRGGELNVVTASELRKLRLDFNRATLGTRQAEFQFSLAAIESSIAQAKVDAAQLEVDSRIVTSPIDGVVVRLLRREGEWTEAGHPICQVVGLDKMRVTGFVNVKEYEQSEILGRTATVTVKLASGKSEEFTGAIGFVSPIVQPGGEYRVWVDVENRRSGDFWILRPGIAAEMSIDVAR